MINFFLIYFGKIFSLISRTLNFGHGSTWPGHIALSLNKNFIKDVLKKNKINTVLIAGTNGKTTTVKLIKTILKSDYQKVLQNTSGANLLNGIASTLLLHNNILCVLNYNYAIFEVDENTLPLALDEIKPNSVILINLFRDQLDRYGEVDTIAKKWKKSLEKLPKETTVILNADDPQIAYLGKNLKTKKLFFGIDDKNLAIKTKQNAADTIHCPSCSYKLYFKSVYFSHLGEWECKNCGEKKPKLNDISIKKYPLSGVYNQYNTNAAVLFAKNNNINNETIERSLQQFLPAFGRQEILNYKGKQVQIFLSKNPTSFNESLRTVMELGGKNILLVLNDRIPDGRDVSWIWDIAFEEYLNDKMNITVSGDRVFDMGLRIKYSSKTQNQDLKFKTYENLKEAINKSLKEVLPEETLFILPTYSAMLEVRKILTGKKIL